MGKGGKPTPKAGKDDHPAPAARFKPSKPTKGPPSRKGNAPRKRSGR